MTRREVFCQFNKLTAEFQLGDAGAPEKIKTVWGHGYLFAPEG